MSHTWKSRNHKHYSYTLEEKNNRHRYLMFHKFHFRYIQIHRTASACKCEPELPGIRKRLLPPDPWEDIIKVRSAYLKPLRHSRLERRRAARKAAVRDMDAHLTGHQTPQGCNIT